MPNKPPILEVPRGNAVHSAQTNESLQLFVRRQLLHQLARQGAVGTRLPPMRRLADQFGVAIGTIQAAVHELVDAGILISRPMLGTVVAPSCNADRIQALLSEGKYGRREHSNLAGKVVQLAYTAGVDRLVDDIARQVTLSLGKLGIHLIEQRCRPQVPAMLHLPDADAMIVIQPPHRFEPKLDARQVLLVIAADQIAVNASDRFDLVSVDDDHGSFLAGRRLGRAGCSRACFIGVRAARNLPSVLDETSTRRLRGFERGWGSAIAAERRLIAKSYNVDPGEQMASSFLAMAPRPDAVFTATDELAVGFIRGVRKHGLEPGRDVHVVGFDKQELALGLPGGPLTTIEVPRLEMAVRGAQLFVERLNDPHLSVRRVLLGCSLFEGTTVGRV